jgi:hypothetical protein
MQITLRWVIYLSAGSASASVVWIIINSEAATKANDIQSFVWRSACGSRFYRAISYSTPLEQASIDFAREARRLPPGGT